MINPNDFDWQRTASGRLCSYKYGYGVLDAYAFVSTAQKWELVKKPQAWVITDTTQLGGGKMPKKHKYKGGVPDCRKDSIEITTAILLDKNLQTLEHIDIRV